MRYIFLSAVMLILCACAGLQEKEIEYVYYEGNCPHSILVMPPVNRSPDIKAPLAFLASVTTPLAESGYYVIPVTLSQEMFRQNGVTVAEEAHAISFSRLHEIFGADAALYITITSFGSRYLVIDSVVEAAAFATLIDLRTGEELWSGRANASLSTGAGGDPIAMLLNAAANQIINTISDKSYDAGRMTNNQMFSAGRRSSIPFGPYHPKYHRLNY